VTGPADDPGPRTTERYVTRRLALSLFVALTAASLTAVGARPAPRSTILQQPVQPGAPADLVFVNGRIVTLERPAEVEAIASRGSRIVVMGSTAEVRALAGPATQVIDLRGRLMIPGFIEGHGHFTGVGQSQLQLNLMRAKSWDEIVAMVREAVKDARPGQWIYGRGWHQEKWTATPDPNVEGFPTHDALSRVSPVNPVLLTHASGHATFANAKAMELSDVMASTPDPPGGDIVKDAGGRPIGVFRETASSLIRRGSGEPPLAGAERIARARKVLTLASREALSKGVTSFQDAGSSFEDVDLMKTMVDEGSIGNRLWVMLRESNTALAANLSRYRTIDQADGLLTIRAIKRSIDGALGSRGAWLLEPYSDKPGDTGRNTSPVEEIRETARLALANGYQLAVHAIGDRANRETLDLFQDAFKGRDGRALRWRIEHAQHLSPADIPRFAQLGVIASMQGVHCTSDAPYVIARLGPRRAAEGAYVWQKLLQSGAIVSNGTDAPVEDVSPIASFHASVSRRTADGTVFFGDQRMSRLEALKSYTINGAYAAFQEGSRGSLQVGKYADMVVLSKDILSIPEVEIPLAEIDYTIVGGKIRYKR
jgi:predicted amidohydrolase YtcJ